MRFESTNDEDLRHKYNNKIIVIDEVHNLRIQNEKGTSEVENKKPGLHLYEQYWKFLHTVNDCKILLLSGTPMYDSVEEIASVMNLLLPEDKQLQTGEEFSRHLL